MSQNIETKCKKYNFKNIFLVIQNQGDHKIINKQEKKLYKGYKNN